MDDAALRDSFSPEHFSTYTLRARLDFRPDCGEALGASVCSARFGTPVDGQAVPNSLRTRRKVE
jgi:hypothetical protein